MVITNDVYLPEPEEFDRTELNLTSSALHAGAFHLGKYCEEQSKEFMLCRDELRDPRKCLQEGSEITGCAIEFFNKVKNSCLQEFVQYQECLIKSSPFLDYDPCRKTQGVFDKCMKDNLNMERPRRFYYTEIKIHESKRPKPEMKVKEFPLQPEKIPDDYPRPEPPPSGFLNIFA